MEWLDFLDPVRVWWVVVGFAIPTTLGAWVGKLKEQAKHAKDEKDSLLLRLDKLEISQRYLLKDRILQACSYWSEKDYCPAHARETVVDMFEAYKAHGGNSFVHEEIDSLLSLPHQEKKHEAQQRKTVA